MLGIIMISEIWSCKLRLYVFSLKRKTIITDSYLVHFYINDLEKLMISLNNKCPLFLDT